MNFRTNTEYAKFFDYHAAVGAVCRHLHSAFFTFEQDQEQLPVVLGGGVVRDALLGGVINDIDIWLPSNIRIQDVHDAVVDLRTRFQTPVDIIFSINTENDAVSENYQDVSNHWVIEFTLRGFKFNIMRTMVEWNEPEQFFTGLMRNFDIDLCMMFVGWTPGINADWRQSVIIPQHMKDDLEQGHVYDIICWNQWRAVTTSDARKDSRNAKMRGRYQMHPSILTNIPRENIRAVPVTVRFLLEHMAQLPLPILPVDETIEVDPEEDTAAPALPTPSLFSSTLNEPDRTVRIPAETRDQTVARLYANMVNMGYTVTNTGIPRS